MEAQGSQAVLTWKQAVSSFVVISNTKPSSRLLYTRTLKLFYEWAEREKLYPNIVKGIKSPKRKNKFVKQHLTDGKEGTYEGK